MKISDFTPEELDALPQTTQVFDKAAIRFDDHQWVQRGYEVLDVCNPGSPACTSSIQIPSGKTLVKKDGRYDLVDEM